MAEKHFIQGGPEAVNIRRIASEVGYTAPNLYKYFSGKEAIIETLIQRRMQEIVKTLDAVDTEGLSTLETFKKKFKAHFYAVLKYKEHYRTVMLSKDPTVLEKTAMLDPERYTRLPAQKKLVETLEHAIENQEIREVDPLLTSQIIWSSLFGLLIRIITEGFDDTDHMERLIEHYLDMCFHGIMA